MSTASAQTAMPACRASQPACSPRTSTTPIFCADCAAWRTRSSMSTAKLRALLNPKESWVTATSFSTDVGTDPGDQVAGTVHLLDHVLGVHLSDAEGIRARGVAQYCAAAHGEVLDDL